MGSTDLRVRIFGRKTKPYAFFLSLATLVVVWMMMKNLAVGELLDGWRGDALGLAAMASFGLLALGWWAQKQSFLEWGLLLSAGVWASVATILGFEFNLVYQDALLAFCWAGASVGAWGLERASE